MFKLWSVVSKALVIAALIPAVAAAAPKVSKIDHTLHREGRTFRFVADGDLSAEGAEAFVDGAVLGLRFAPAEVEKSWPEFDDPRITRTLMFNSHQKADSVVLRVRFTEVKSLPRSFAGAVRFEAKGDTLLAHVPLLPDEAPPAVAEAAPAVQVKPALMVAPAEAAPAKKTSAIKAVGFQVPTPVDPGPDPLRTEARPVITPGAEAGKANFLAQIDPPAPKAAPVAPASALAAELAELPAAPAAEGAAKEAVEKALDAVADAEPAAEAPAALAPLVKLPEEPLMAEDSALAGGEKKTYTNALAAKADMPFSWSLIGVLALGLVALFMLKRLKRRQAGAVDGRLITPLSSHLLGPRHGLLLVDVAGDHVLLGTSDKGVQMLTKITPSQAVARAIEAGAEGLGADRYDEVEAPIPQTAPSNKARAAFRQVFNSVTGRVPMIEDDEPATPSAVPPRAQPVKREDSGLLEAVSQVRDVPQTRSPQTRSPQTRGPQTRPITPVTPEAEGDEDGVAADLLSRIRKLQSA